MYGDGDSETESDTNINNHEGGQEDSEELEVFKDNKKSEIKELEMRFKHEEDKSKSTDDYYSNPSTFGLINLNTQ